jgi:hypothetical protein
MSEMDYLAQKPDLDLRAFFEGRGASLAESAPEPITRYAPPPKDTYWVAPEPVPDTEEE